MKVTWLPMTSSIKFVTVNKDRIYYDRWHYAMSFYIAEASALRDMDHAVIDRVIEARQRWREVSQQRWVRGANILQTRFPKPRPIDNTTTENLHSLADVLIHTSCPYKSVVSINHMWIYSNDPDLFEKINALPFIQGAVFTQARASKPRNTVLLKNPQHQHRSYFRAVKLSTDQKTHIANFLRNSQSHVRLSPSLTQWLDNKFMRLQDYFFVDYSTDTWPTMLNLVQPGLIRKTMQIQQTK